MEYIYIISDNSSEKPVSEEFETVMFANSLPSAGGAAVCSSGTSTQNKKKRKSPCGDTEDDVRLKIEFINLEKERNRAVKEYRAKKLAFYEKITQQQGEMIQLQMRTATALELIASRCQRTATLIPSPFSVSPIIRFDS
ncbi:uncharacterized protein LOC130049292 [Ostrea edulis]|uniref:uncharacterized protein LOC130049292 n=1 Tax=Ostrea edulis TaxID=37623 RepID=UPI0024AF934F|nr:uncharacterized protein LOC130049292 [Ostrea edulis]